VASRSGAAWRLRGSGAAELTGSLKSATQELTVTLEHNSTTSEFRRQTQNEDAAASFEVQGCAEEGKHILCKQGLLRKRLGTHHRIAARSRIRSLKPCETA